MSPAWRLNSSQKSECYEVLINIFIFDENRIKFQENDLMNYIHSVLPEKLIVA